MKTKSSIDWLSITYPFQARLERILPRDTEYTFKEIKSPIPVYKTAFEIMPIGAKLLVGSERLGQHVIYSGKAMNELVELEIPISDIYETIKSNRAHVSRIDLAVDVFDCMPFTPEAVKEKFMKGEALTHFTRNKEIAENNETETFYFGRMDSKIAKCRVYNKALERKLDMVWTRVEYEKRKNADNWIKAIFENGQSIKALIKTSVDFPNWKLWQEIFDEDKGAIPRIDKEDDTYDKLLDWILNSALPAMARLIVMEAKTNDKFSLEKSTTINVINQRLELELKSALLAENVEVLREKDVELIKELSQ